MLNFNENINLIVKNYKGTESIKNGNLFKISSLYYTSGIENLIYNVNSINSLSKNINNKINNKKIWIIADSTNIPQERKIRVLLPSEY